MGMCNAQLNVCLVAHWTSFQNWSGHMLLLHKPKVIYKLVTSICGYPLLPHHSKYRRTCAPSPQHIQRESQRRNREMNLPISLPNHIKLSNISRLIEFEIAGHTFPGWVSPGCLEWISAAMNPPFFDTTIQTAIEKSRQCRVPQQGHARSTRIHMSTSGFATNLDNSEQFTIVHLKKIKANYSMAWTKNLSSVTKTQLIPSRTPLSCHSRPRPTWG